MTKSTGQPQGSEPDDAALVSFLRAHAPPISEPRPNLEHQLMQTISAESSRESVRCEAVQRESVRQQSRLSRIRWSTVALIGLGVSVITIGAQIRQWLAPPVTSAELAELESFMVGDWNATVQPRDTVREWDWLDSKLTNTPASISVQHSVPLTYPQSL